MAFFFFNWYKGEKKKAELFDFSLPQNVLLQIRFQFHMVKYLFY
jgi:hypothetical protein